MDLDLNDLALIEQALREGVNQGTDYQKSLAYQGVLTKLQSEPDMMQLNRANESEPMHDRYEFDDHT